MSLIKNFIGYCFGDLKISKKTEVILIGIADKKLKEIIEGISKRKGKC